MAESGFNPTRRQFFRGDLADQHRPLRLPWSVDEQGFVAGCTRCERCLQACPEGIVAQDAAGFPTLNFTQGACTFCGACVDACPEPLFLLDHRQSAAPPWFYRAQVSGSCIAHQGIECRACEDACEPLAIRFMPRLGGIAQPDIHSELCTGCGACIAPCPVQAIAIVSPESLGS